MTASEFYCLEKQNNFFLNHLTFSHSPIVPYIKDPKLPQNPTHIFTILISGSMQAIYIYVNRCIIYSRKVGKLGKLILNFT